MEEVIERTGFVAAKVKSEKSEEDKKYLDDLKDKFSQSTIQSLRNINEDEINLPLLEKLIVSIVAEQN